jgi:maleylpyruvate isomerase
MVKRSLVLYGYWRSSSAYRVRIALAAKKIAYESVAINLTKGEQASPAHLARNPMGFVPCLLVDGKPFVESVAIIELLDDLFPEVPLFPRDPLARARVRALVEIINAGTQPLQNLRVLDRVSKEPALRKDWASYFIAHGLTAFEALMRASRNDGTKGPFAYGDAMTAADAFLLPQLYNARRFGMDLEPYPLLRAAEAAGFATEAARAAAPENQPDAPREG